MSDIRTEQAVAVPFINGVNLNIIPSEEHSFLLSTKEVAKGYGVSESVLRNHLQRHSDELIENKHFFSSVSNRDARSNLETKTTLWTKQGVIRLGFFIKSERAKLF